jgi:hypothetical protein
MKQFLIIVVLLLAQTIFAQVPPTVMSDLMLLATRANGAEDITNGLYAQWTFEEGAGTAAQDSSSNRFNLTLYNTPTWVAGKIGSYALKFQTGTPSSYASASTLTDLAFTNGSITWWTWQTNTYNSGVIRAMWGQCTLLNSQLSGEVWSNDSWYIGWDGSIADDRIPLVASSSNWPTQTWFHCSFVWTATNSILYENAIPLATNSSPPHISNLGVPFNIAYLGNGNVYFSGAIDDFRIYTNSLSPSQISYLYHTYYGQP